MSRAATAKRRLRPAKAAATLGVAVGALFVLAGLSISEASWLSVFRPELDAGTALWEQLQAGASLFRVSLIAVGLTLCILPFLPVWSPEAKVSMPTEKRDPRYVGALGALLAAGLALRLYRLETGLWFDEILMYVNYGGLSLGEIFSTYDSQNQHMLFTLSARLATYAFGDTAWALRLPAALYGVASIGALYLLARQLGTKREALLSAALMTFSYHHIWFSQNARGYTGLLFWTLLASWYFVRGLREGRAQVWLLYALTAALGVFTHVTMLFVVFGHFAIYAGHQVRAVGPEKPGRWLGFFLGFVLAGGLTLLLYALVLPQMLVEFTSGGMGVDFKTWQNPLWTILEVVRSVQVGFAGGAVALVGLVVFGVGLWSWWRRDALVVQLLFVPVFICTAVTLATGHNFWPRLFFFAMGFGILVVIRGLFAVGEAVGRKVYDHSTAPAWGGYVSACGLIALSALSVPFAYGPKQNYDGPISYIETNLKPGDVVVTTGMASYVYTEYYAAAWPAVSSADDLSTLRATAQRTWLIYAFPPFMRAVYPDVQAAIERDFTVVERFEGTLGGGVVYVCLAQGPPPVAEAVSDN